MSYLHEGSDNVEDMSWFDKLLEDDIEQNSVVSEINESACLLKDKIDEIIENDEISSREVEQETPK